jgi:Zn-dependent protease with chaperone function
MRTGVWGIAAVFVVSAAAAPVDALDRKKNQDGPAERALAFFERSDSGVDALIDGLRPSPLPSALVAAVIAALPPEGELNPTSIERAKIAALDAVFERHERKGRILVKVVDVGHAFVGLHARTVLLLSRDALSILDADELQALAAHELGHELFWNDYQEARARSAHEVTREIELRCDAVAVATLLRMGRTHEPLIRALARVTRYNEARGATANAANYPSLKDRRRFIEAVARLAAGAGRLPPREP